MTRRVALLGSINVGGNRVAMADLKAAFAADGFAGIATVAASGNVVFEAGEEPDAALASRIADLVKDNTGIDTFAAVRTREELARALSDSPFAAGGADNMVHVMFLEAQPDAAAFARLAADHAGRGPERLAPGDRALHMDYVDGVAGSKLTRDFIERRLGCRGTARNVRSIRRIMEAMER
ncbi:DUF1697 domain-containing protein [Aurantiacibacter spongiae]|uniref:DUF1697 domain-containing protein n=1 Tax=Aurantiacibacter spongiae TaxID=2488860 RepID=A0A3N5DML6_9SPHN|nr:DUF1697 domain-containing protein [Aurantiacibacter spongiae]RPF72125.1 DUF1697 domain-containing protein [Aurantiacibacter spongiae]